MLSSRTAPDRAVGYESADAVVWLNPDPARMDSPAQREALVGYVRQGGHLVVAAGAAWQALAQSFLAELLPAQPVGSRLVHGLRIADYGMTIDDMDPSPIRNPQSAIRNRVVLMQMEAPHGEVLMKHGEHPVIVRDSFGAGRVTLIGFDPTKRPFTDLKDHKKFWTGILAMDTARRNSKQVASMRKISGPLIRSLNDFPGFKPINFMFVGIFLLVYVILIGPVDYFVLKRLKKLHWTWVTFPAIAVISSVLAFWLLSSGRVAGLHANGVSLVDGRAGSDEITGTSFMTMLSPRQKRYDVTVKNAVTWSLAPREFEVFSGARGVGMGRTECYVSPAGQGITGLLVRIWDAQTLQSSWSARAPALPAAALSRTSNELRGRVTNSTRQELFDVAVLFAGRVIRLGDMRPGQTATLDGKPSHGIASYANSLMPDDLRHDRGFRRWGELSARRKEADGAARWVSLFSCAGHGRKEQEREEEFLFRRWAPTEQEYLSVAFDLPGRLELTGLDSREEAILLYSTNESYAEITLEGESPKRWHRTVMRMKVPVTGE